MTEKEKMQNQVLYDANFDQELIAERVKAKDLCFEYNQLRPSDTERQIKVMKKILGKTKKNFSLIAPFWCDYGYNIEIGENFFANHNTVILDAAKVRFGDNVWIGGGSVVVKDIPDNSVAVGNPCRVIRQITEADRKTVFDRK